MEEDSCPEKLEGSSSEQDTDNESYASVDAHFERDVIILTDFFIDINKRRLLSFHNALTSAANCTDMAEALWRN